jgi:hypothetical protein
MAIRHPRVWQYPPVPQIQEFPLNFTNGREIPSLFFNAIGLLVPSSKLSPAKRIVTEFISELLIQVDLLHETNLIGRFISPGPTQQMGPNSPVSSSSAMLSQKSISVGFRIPRRNDEVPARDQEKSFTTFLTSNYFH